MTEVLISLVPSLTGHAGYIAMVYRSKLISREKTVTPVNLSQRWSFNLDASLVSSQRPGAASVTGHEISIGASPSFSACSPTPIWPVFSGRIRHETKWSQSLDRGIHLRLGFILSWFSTTKVNRQSPSVWIQWVLEISYLVRADIGQDDYFLFYEASVSPLPRRLPVDHLQFYNMVENILTQKCLSRYPALRLESRKAGIALRFFTNRMSIFVVFLCQLMSHRIWRYVWFQSSLDSGPRCQENCPWGIWHKWSGWFIWSLVCVLPISRAYRILLLMIRSKQRQYLLNFMMSVLISSLTQNPHLSQLESHTYSLWSLSCNPRTKTRRTHCSFQMNSITTLFSWKLAWLLKPRILIGYSIIRYMRFLTK